MYMCVCAWLHYKLNYIKCIKYIFILLKKRRYRQLKMYRFYCSGFSQIQTEVWRDVSNLFFLFLFMLTVSTVNSSLPQSVVWSVVFISWAVLECCVKPWLVLPSLLRCCGGGRGVQPLWEHEPRLDEAPNLLQNCSADKDKSANTSADGLRKTGVHSRNCHHTEKRLWNIELRTLASSQKIWTSLVFLNFYIFTALNKNNIFQENSGWEPAQISLWKNWP